MAKPPQRETDVILAQLRGVYKRFGAIKALRGVDLAIHLGEVVALLGANGAGKTTTIDGRLGPAVDPGREIPAVVTVRAGHQRAAIV